MLHAKSKSQRQLKPVVETLESRLLFSTDPIGLAAGLVSGASVEIASGLLSADSAEQHSTLALSNVEEGARYADQRSEVVFISSAIDNYAALLQDIVSSDPKQRQIAVYVIDAQQSGPQQSGLDQINALLAAHTELDAIHLITHGNQDGFYIGSSEITESTLALQHADFQKWGQALASEGDILLYGCELASSEQGRSIVETIAEISRADVAASNDLTGHQKFGADWQLEYSDGLVETTEVVSEDAGENWQSVLAVINVNTTLDVVDTAAVNLTSVGALLANPGTDGLVSLREAIIAANAEASADEIRLNAGTYKLTLDSGPESGDLDIVHDLFLRGQGQGLTVIDANGIDRVIDIAGGDIRIENLTLTGGVATDGAPGGGVSVDNASLIMNGVKVDGNETDTQVGGGIWVSGTASLKMSDSTISNNVAGAGLPPGYSDGGGLYSLGLVNLLNVIVDSNIGNLGGGLYNADRLRLVDVSILNNQSSSNGGGVNSSSGDFTMDRVTIHDNSAVNGGGLDIHDTVANINNSTFSGNTVTGSGGGIRGFGGASVEINSSTVAYNTADTEGGGLQGNNQITIENTLFAHNTSSGANAAIDGTVVSNGFNLIQDAAYSSSHRSDIVGVDPNISVLQDNGGLVKTHALLAGSAAINSGSGSAALDATKNARNVLPDIGAFEYQQSGDLGKIFWTDYNEEAIYRANADGNAVQMILQLPMEPSFIEIDIDNGRIYWAENDIAGGFGTTIGSIKSADLDGNNVVTVVSGLLNSAGLAFDLDSRYLYVTSDANTSNSGAGPYVNKILRFSMDVNNQTAGSGVVMASGSHAESVPERMVFPTDVEFDADSNKLFWTDQGEAGFASTVGEEIKVLDLGTASPPAQLMGSPVPNYFKPYGLAVVPGGEEIFWANGLSVSRIDLTSGSAVHSASAAPAGQRVLSVHYDASSDLVYFADFQGSIKSISRDLSTTNTVISGLESPITLAVAAVAKNNISPTASQDAYSVVEGATENLAVSSNDNDVDDGLDLSSIEIISGPINGSVSINNNGSLDYTHNGSETVSDSFSYTINDNAGAHSNIVTVDITITPTNDAPIAYSESYTVAEGSTTNLAISANDSDEEGALDKSSITIVSGPTNGSVVVKADGTVDYTHDGSETSSDTFTYTIKDMEGVLSNTATVTLAVTPHNDAPVAVADTYFGSEGGNVNLNVSQNDSDAENTLDLSSIVIVSGPVNGLVFIRNDGSVDYTHDGSETLADNFSYTIQDTDGAVSNTVAVSLTILPVNDTPVAAADTFTVVEGSTTNLSLLDNDADAENSLDAGSVTIVVGPTHGAVSVNADGTVDYTHDGSETLADTFSYSVDDAEGLSSNIVLVSLTVTPDNDAPVAVIDSYTVVEGSTTNLPVSSNDTDIDSSVDPASIIIVSGPTNGSVSINVDGSVDYTHDGSETVADSFSYTIDDVAGATSNTVVVSLTITPENDAPFAVADSYTVVEGSTTNLPISSNDTDIDSTVDPASILIVSGPVSGFVSVKADGSIDYTHDGSETVADSFSYTIDDAEGATSNTVLVSLTITPENDAPVAVADSYTVVEGSTTNLAVASNDTDIDNALDLDSITVVSGPLNGTINVNPDGSIDYTHDGSETNADSFSYTIDDAAGLTSNAVVVSLIITPENDAPVAVADAYIVREGSTTNLPLSSNDSDIDSALDLGSIAIVSYPANGSVSINADGSIDYTHNGSETVSDSFSYTIDDIDGLASNTVVVSLAIVPENDAPIAVADSYTVVEGSTNILPISGNDTDVDSALDLDSIVIVNNPVYGSVSINADGSINYTHDGSESTADSFSYTIDDAEGFTSNRVLVLLTISPENDAPIAVTDNYTVFEGATINLEVLSNDTDTDSVLNVNGIAIVTGPLNGDLAVNSDGTIDYKHDGSETLTDSFSYTVEDQQGLTSNPVIVHLTVLPVNDQPLAISDIYSVTEASTTNIPILDNDVDRENDLDPTSLTIVDDPDHGSLVVKPDGSVDYTHDGSETDNDSFRYTIADNSGLVSYPTIVSLSIESQNDQPVAKADSGTLFEGSTLNLNLLANDVDPEGQLDPTSIVIESAPGNGSLVILPDGSVDYTHDGSETLTDSFNYSVKDMDGLVSNNIGVSLLIHPVNDVPDAVPDRFEVVEGSVSNLSVAVNDSDAEDQLDSSSVSIVTSAVNGSLSVNADGTIRYEHNGSETDSDVFSYSIADTEGLRSQVVIVSLSITGVNDNPVGRADQLSLIEGGEANLSVLDNDSDIDDGLDATSVTIVDGPTSGSVSVLTDGSVIYVHNGSESTSDNFSYTVSDLTGASSGPVVVDVVIDPANDAPEISGSDLTAEAGELLVLSPQLLSVTDPDSEDSQLQFNVQQVVGGHFALLTAPDIPILSFSQSQLANSEIAFVINDQSESASYAVSANDGQASGSVFSSSIRIIAKSIPELAQAVPDKSDTVPEKLVEAEQPALEAEPDTPAEPVEANAPVIPQLEEQQATVEIPEFSHNLAFFTGNSESKVDRVVLETLFSQPEIYQTRMELEWVRHQFELPVFSGLELTEFNSSLNKMHGEIVANATVPKGLVGSGFAITSSLTVGYVIWLIRGGVLLSTVLSSLPAWQLIDPLPVLSNSGGGKHGDDDSLQSIIAEQSQAYEQQHNKQRVSSPDDVQHGKSA